jgi:redox-sensitive bicupin YhaK (pirin superfamily)
MPIEVRKAADRDLTEIDGRSTAHSFAFGPHYDPRNLSFGAMIAHNDELLAPGAGYDDHVHRDTEIVTWVVSGALQHTDDLGHSTVVVPGQVQVLSAGAGVTHAEVNAATTPTRVIQTWLRPDGLGLEPRYTVETVPAAAGWTVLAGPGGVPLNTAGATLYLGRCAADSLALPQASRLHVFVIDGAVTIGEREIRCGSAARLTDEGGRAIHPSAPETTVLVWALG